MNNPFEFRAVPKTVKDELALRAQFADRKAKPVTPMAVNYRITSMCEQCDDNYQLASPTLRNKINPTTGLITYPSVYGISIKKQGELGTTKKCTISITCYNEDQLFELQKCYFIPGMSVRVEIWTIDAPPPAIDKTLSNNEAILKMSKHTNETSANYEGLQGVVTNFTYSLQKSGLQFIWVCTVEVVSASASSLNHPTSAPCKNTNSLGGPVGTVGQQCETSVPGPDGEKRLEIRSSLYNHFKLLNSVSRDFLDNADYLKKVKDSITPSSYLNYFIHDTDRYEIFTKPYCQLRYRGASRFVSTARNLWEKLWGTEEGGEGINYAHEYYITWGRLELLINELVYNGTTFTNLKGKTVLNSEGVLLPWSSNYISTDPRVCVLTEGTWQDYLFKQGDDGWSSAVSYAKNGVVTNTDGSQSLHLQHILLNVVMLQNMLDEVEGEGGDGLISTFIQKVLDQVSTATGGVWELIVTASPTPQTNLEVGSAAETIFKNAHAHITVLEMKGSGVKEVEPYVIPSVKDVGGDKSVIREIDFEMKMTDAMKTQALYAGKTSLSNNACAGAAHTAFNLSNTFVNLAGTFGSENLDECKPCKNNFPDDKEKPAVGYAQWMFDFKESQSTYEDRGFFQFPDYLIIEDVSVESLSKAYRAALDSAINDATTGATPICKGQPLPFSLKISVAGIGGFGFGQLITTSLIPETIRDVYYYQILAVEHDFSNQTGWITTITTVPRTKSKGTATLTTGAFEPYKKPNHQTKIVYTGHATNTNAKVTFNKDGSTTKTNAILSTERQQPIKIPDFVQKGNFKFDPKKMPKFDPNKKY